MLKAISWSEYGVAMVILLGLYYAAVAIIFYRKEIQDFIQSKRKAANGAMASDAGSLATVAPQALQEEEAAPHLTALELLINDIDSTLEQAGTSVSKEQLLPQLHQRLASFAGLREPAYRVAVFNHTIRKAEELCGVRLSEEELAGS